jgi:hypothetical protein
MLDRLLTAARRPHVIARAVLVAALVLATWPAWRVLLLGDNPTLDELLQLICSAP